MRTYYMRVEEMMRPDDKESSKSSDDGQMRNDGEMTDEKEKPRTTSSTGKAKITWADVVVGKERRELRKMDNSFREALTFSKQSR
jgi:hypothetical protein